MRGGITTVPPRLPPRLTPPKIKQYTLLDEVHSVFRKLYDGEDPSATRFQSYMNTTCNRDSVTGKAQFDYGFAALLVKERAADEPGAYPLITEASLAEIAAKFQWCLKRHDAPGLPWSRSARMRALEFSGGDDNNDGMGEDE